jgi:hypothetical protein
MLVKILTAVNQGWDAAKASKDEANNLANTLHVCIRAQVMLSSNL